MVDTQERTFSKIIMETPFDVMVCSNGSYDKALAFINKSGKWRKPSEDTMKVVPCPKGPKLRNHYWFFPKT